jgi:hypothetical protein
MVRELVARPEPLQVSQGSWAMSPRPLQSTQGSVSEKPPPPPRDTWPVPTHVGQTRGEPFLSPVPAQDLHAAEEDIRSGPVDRLGEAERHLGLDVLPAPRLRTGTGAATAEQPAEDVADPATAAETAGPARASGLPASEEVAQIEVEPARTAGPGPDAAAAEQGARLVVLLAALGVAEHVVRLGRVLETLLGLGVAPVGVGVVLPGELAVGLLDLGLGGVLGDAENLVVVLLDEVLRTHPRRPSSPMPSPRVLPSPA